MKKLRYEFEALDDFEIGDCHSCHLQGWEWYDDDGYNDCYSYCTLSSSNGCPLIEVESENE